MGASSETPWKPRVRRPGSREPALCTASVGCCLIALETACALCYGLRREFPATVFGFPGRLTRGFQGVSLEIPGSGPPFVKNQLFIVKSIFSS